MIVERNIDARGAIIMNLLEKLQKISTENVKVDFCRSQLWNSEPSNLPVKCRTIVETSSFCYSLLPLFRGVWFWFYVTVQKRLTKEVFWCEKDILSDWVFLNFPILPFDVRLVFSSRKVCISQKRQSLLIYQTYQPAPQTDSTRQFRILKIILYFSKVTYCSLFLMRIFWFFCRFQFFPQLDNLASKEKNVGHAAVSNIQP